MAVYVEDETLVIEESYYTFEEVLAKLEIEYTLDGSWMNNIYTKYGLTAPEALDFYKALGIFLKDSHVALCTDLEKAEDKILMIMNKNDMIIEDYLAYFNAITQEITELKSKSVTRFNDTPTEEGDFTADKYTSNITQSENSVEYDINTKINIAKRRLKHLKESYCNEFKRMIIWTN